MSCGHLKQSIRERRNPETDVGLIVDDSGPRLRMKSEEQIVDDPQSKEKTVKLARSSFTKPR